jgi:hypothetical protein
MATRGGARSTSFKKGQSGNPRGRPKELADLKLIARSHTKEAVERLVHWMRSDDPRASVAAADKLMGRGWGRPPQAVTGAAEGNVVLNIVTGVPRAPDDP